MSWRHANDTFVATNRVGVAPGVKMELKRLVRKSAMLSIGSFLDRSCVVRDDVRGIGLSTSSLEMVDSGRSKGFPTVTIRH